MIKAIIFDLNGVFVKRGKEVPEMVELGRKLKAQGLQIFFLSNNLKETTDYYLENFDFLHELPEKIYFSWQTGFIKPDEQGFQLILTENNLLANECLFIDDLDSNIQVAEKLGFQAFKFEGSESVVKILKNIEK
jgi:putative hydrolase of the HAD superfamily